jgi:HrpA-like RNA helicase
MNCSQAMIPVDLRLGKMLVLASIFRCLDPILTVVAILSSKPFFLNPMDKREEAKKCVPFPPSLSTGVDVVRLQSEEYVLHVQV